MPTCGVGLFRSPDTDRFENAFDDKELAEELSRMGERLQTLHYPGRDGDVSSYEKLQEEVTRRARARGEDPSAAEMPAPSGDPARDAAIAEVYAALARSDAEEKKEQEEEAAAEKAATASKLPTTLSLLNQDPRFEDQQFTEDTVLPEVIGRRIRKKEEEKKEQELQRSDRTRHDRLMALRGKVFSREWPKREIAGLLRGYSMRDLQVLRRYGLEWYSWTDSKESFKENVLEAIDKYDYEWRKENKGTAADAPSMSELSPEDDYAIKKDQWQAEYFKYWLQGWQHVSTSVAGAGGAWVTSQFTDDPKKIAAGAELATAISGSLGGWLTAKANKGTYVPDVENKPFDPTGPWRYSGPARTEDAPKKTLEPDSPIPLIPRRTDAPGRPSFPRELPRTPDEEYRDFINMLREQTGSGEFSSLGDPFTMQPHSGARDARRMLNVSGADVQSMHGLPQAVGRDVPGYNPRSALTVLDETPTHTGMDAYWKTRFQEMRREGRTTAAAEDIYDVLAESIQRAPDLTQPVKESMKRRLHDEMFVDYQMTGQTVTLPYPNIPPDP